MKALKIFVLAFGALGLVLLLTSDFGLILEADKVFALLMLAAFALPTVMGAMGLAKPPFQAWQGAVALAGFALAAVKTKIWEGLPHIMDVGTKDKLFMLSIVGGVIVSALAIAKPEDKA